MAFDFGTQVATPAQSFVNPEVGQHAARLRSIIHLGMLVKSYKGKEKPAAPYVAAVFELKEDEDKTDDGTPFSIIKEFPLMRSDKAFLTQFMKGLLTAEEFALFKENKLDMGFEDLIGRSCQLDLVGSDATDDKGAPKYVNVGAVTPLHPKLAALCSELEVQGVGHMTLDKMTVQGVRELSKYIVATDMMHGLTYTGSKAEEAVNAILAEDPAAFTIKAATKPAKPEVKVDLDADKEF